MLGVSSFGQVMGKSGVFTHRMPCIADMMRSLDLEWNEAYCAQSTGSLGSAESDLVGPYFT